MTLVDLKLTKKEAKASEENIDVTPSKHTYPWGMTLTLDNESLSKLKLNNATIRL